jgi:hypothetical protein
MKHLLAVSGLVFAALFANGVQGADLPVYKLIIKDHAFQPSELSVPAGIKFKVLVVNQDSSPSEFESTEFNREKIVLPESSVTVFVGPLSKGRYKFFDDFHRDTGNGVLIVQ